MGGKGLSEQDTGGQAPGWAEGREKERERRGVVAEERLASDVPSEECAPQTLWRLLL